MRKIVLWVLAIMLWSQAVDALICYDCPRGSCFKETTCPVHKDQCLIIMFQGSGIPLRIAKRCGTQAECQLMNSVPQSGLKAICCGVDRCNR